MPKLSSFATVEVCEHPPILTSNQQFCAVLSAVREGIAGRRTP